MVKYFYNATNLRKLAKTASNVCFIVSGIGLLLTIIIHLNLGGDLDNLFEFASGYVIACVVVALVGVIFLGGLKKCADGVEKTQREYAQNAEAIFKKMLSEYSEEELTKETEAKIYAKALQTMLLKTPASAKFCELDEIKVTLSNGIYQVNGYVDSQNSYGAMVRTNFAFKVKEDGTWKYVDNILSPAASFIVNFLFVSFICVAFGVVMTILTYFFFSNII